MTISLVLLITSTWAAEPVPPAVEVQWKKQHATLSVLSPLGEHVAPEATLSLDLLLNDVRTVVEKPGEGGTVEVILPGASPWDLEGTLRVSLCVDGGSACRTAEVALAGTLEGKKGRKLLDLSEPADTVADAHPAVDAHLGWEDAQARALEDGKPVLIDFYARWCPPCNLLIAEVLDAPAHAEALTRVHVVRVDSDLPQSWTLKDRYRVGGYPTVVLVDPEGLELGRLEGYPGEAETLAWLDERVAAESLDARLERVRGDSFGEGIGRLAFDLSLADREDEAREVVALTEETDPWARVVAVRLDESAEAAWWLIANHPELLVHVLYELGAVIEADPSLGSEIAAVASPILDDLDPMTATDWLDLLAETAGEDEAMVIKGAAAALVRTTLTGDPAADRGRWSALAWYLEGAGDVDGAIAVLQTGIDAYPREFTWHYSLARLHFRQERFAEAVEPAQSALTHAEGDMRLRAAMVLAQVYDGADRHDEAVAVLEAEIQNFQRPDEALQVRAHRYLGQAEALLETLLEAP